MSRLAQDLKEFILHRKLERITLLGHSMGSSVIWAYLDSYGDKNLKGLIIDDQPAAITLLDSESETSKHTAGQ